MYMREQPLMYGSLRTCVMYNQALWNVGGVAAGCSRVLTRTDEQQATSWQGCNLVALWASTVLPVAWTSAASALHMLNERLQG